MPVAVSALSRCSALVLALAMSTVTSGWATEDARPAGVMAPLRLTPSKTASPDVELRAAILSIHAYVEKHRKDAPLADVLARVEPMSLKEAMEILRRDDSSLGDLHRRRALLRLLVWVPGRPEVRPAIEGLVGVDKANALFAALRSPMIGGGCDDPDPDDVANDAVNEVLGKASYGECPKIEKMSATVVKKGDPIGIASSLVVEGSFDAARKGLDAQRWKSCSPLWARSYLVKLDQNDEIEENLKCQQGKRAECMPKEGAPSSYGEPYDTDGPPKRPLFENFVCDGLPCDVRLLLHIKTARSDGTYHLGYDQPMPWKDFPYPTADYGDVSLKAEDLGDGSGNQRLTVVSDKTFGFDDWGTNAAIYFLLRRIEMASYLADLVCCKRP